MVERIANLEFWKIILIVAAIIAVTALVIWGLLRLNRYIFKRIQKKHNGLQIVYFEKISGAIILIGGVILVFSIIGGIENVWKTLLGGTAIISAVLIFAAQDVVKDTVAGLMISINKPFEIGNRIELEDGTAGIVKDMTMRHVVLLGLDTQYYVIPNSKLNAMKLKNYSYHVETRSANFNFYVAYTTDVKQAMRVIKDAIISSEYSIPGKQTAHGADYAEIYFMSFEESSLRMATTVYFNSDTPSEILISDINLRVNQALADNGIEIPYNYINVIQKSEQDE